MSARPRSRMRGIVGELRSTLTLAVPVILAELGWMGMGVVDTLMVGALGAEAIGAVSLASVAYFTPVIFGMGLLLGLDTLVSHAFGAGDRREARRWLSQGLVLAIALTPPLMAITLALGPALSLLGVQPAVLEQAIPYLRIEALGTLPLLVYSSFRRYLQAVDRPGPVTFALISANVVNALGNWALIHGHLGMPALGLDGSAWATTAARVYMAGVLVIAAALHDRRHGMHGASEPGRWKPDLARIRRLIALGLPAAGHVTLEVGVFALATALAGRFEPAALAAHQIVLNVASVTFMIPLGLSSAGAVRVGQAIGRGDPAGAARSGWATLGLGVGFMAVAALAFATCPRWIVGQFSDDARVLAVGVPLMWIAAAFQLFDGVQGVTTGNLRGLGDTHTAMISQGIAHWAVGLPVGYLLAFPAGLGISGLWLGLSLGLVVAALLLLYAWVARTRL